MNTPLFPGIWRPLLSLMIAVFLVGCASKNAQEAHSHHDKSDYDESNDDESNYDDPTTNDPFENFNRASFELNNQLDKALFRPLAQAYLKIPEDGRDSIGNLIDHYQSPVDLANAILQGQQERSGDILGRFLLNSIIGIGGIFDPAGYLGIPKVSEDFGQTLATWGVESGPYIVAPVFGPSNPRDLFGRGVDVFLDPLTYIFNGQNFGTQASIIRSGVTGTDQRAEVMEVLDDIQANSLDFYATIRSLSRQRRENQIHNGETFPGDSPEPIDVDDLPGLGNMSKVDIRDSSNH